MKKKNNKRWLLVLLIAFPSVFWLLLETSTVNSRRLHIYGPRTVNEKGDTVYHRTGKLTGLPLNDMAYVAVFVPAQYQSEGYRVKGLWEFFNYKYHKVEQLPFVFIADADSAKIELANFTGFRNVSFVQYPRETFDGLRRAYFAEKPYFIDYSFLVLIDGEGKIRGYYDGRLSAEVKRLTEEYRHLRMKEEKQKMIRNNEIEQQN